MKNLSKRTKMLLAIAGVVIVVIVAGLVLLGPGDEALFGGTVIHISPQNPTINVDQNIDMSINSVLNCTWSSTDESVIQLWNWHPDYSRKIQVLGLKPGYATVKANCGMNRYTKVVVRTQPVIIPANPTIKVGQSVTFTTDGRDPTCKWSMAATSYSQHAYMPAGQGVAGVSAVVIGKEPGIANVSVWDCPNGGNRTSVTVVQ